ncbi:MAG: hypothetical protein HKL95_04705, partial [Phycisphaerae bacterium]|nr:hypothetical protein [Phycisphaerae bacterium]
RSFWGKRFYAQLAAQYDRHNLYIAAHFRSFGPITNAKRESTLQGYGGGDALQIRLSDGKKKVNLCGWYDSADKSPALTADWGDLPSPFLLKQGAREAFAADADGRGYVQELALPWKVLFGGTPQHTARLAATFQLWWADLTPRFSFYASTTLQRRGALAVRYKMPADDDLSLGLFDPQGHLLRWLMRDDYCYAGPNRVFWNGLDQWGRPVPPGHYVIKGLYHPALTTQYKMTLDNPGSPPWPTPDNHGDWLADESIPQAAATDGKWVFLGAPDWEKGVGIIAVNQKGQRQWGSRVAAGGRCISLAVDGNYLYALYSGPISTDTSRIYLGHHAIGRALLVCLDKRTGNPARFSLKHPAMRIATWRYRQDYHWLWTLRNHHSFSAATYGGQPRYFATEVGETTDALGVAAIGNRVYASLFYNNKIEVVNALTGKPTGQTIAVQAPVGLCAVDAHTLLAVSGKQVVKINLAGNTVTPLITSHLVAPFDVTRDAVGRIYVSDWGKSFQVKVFDAHGKFLHAVGKPGGRPWVGKWVSDGMLLPRGIAVTNAGKLWVAEEDGSPCRISVWNAQTGTLLKQYIGPTPYGGGTFFWVDPKDPTQMVAEGTRFKVNLVKKTSKPEAIVFRRRGIDDPFTPDGHGSAWGHCQVMYHDGHQYVAMNVSGNMLTIMRREGDVYRPVAALGSEGGPISPKLKLDGTQIDCWDSDLGHHEYEGYFPPCFRYHFGQNYSWSDTNGDHLVQPDEMHWVKTVHGVPYKKGTQPTLGDGWGTALGPDWSYYASGDYRDHVVIFRLDIKGWSANGAPLYDMADAKPIVPLPRGWSINGLYVTHDNHLIVCYNYEWGSSHDTIGCYDRDGRYLWAIARPVAAGYHAARGSAGLLTENTKNVHANNAVYDFKLPGVGDVVGTWLWHGNIRPYLFTTDGLYVGTLLQNTLLGPKALWGESYTYFFQTPAGTPYVVNGGTDAEDILQIHGLKPDQVGRFTTSYTLTA